MQMMWQNDFQLFEDFNFVKKQKEASCKIYWSATLTHTLNM